MCKLCCFFFLTESADRELSDRVEMSTVCIMSPAYIVLHVPSILAWIFIVYLCSFVYAYVCVCARKSESQCGCKSPAGVWGKKQQEAEKIPAAFGLVSANRKPGTVLHVPVHSLKASPCGIIKLFFSQSVIFLCLGFESKPS